MSNATELAEAIVGAGIGQKSESYPDVVVPGFYAIDSLDETFPSWGLDDVDPWKTAEQFINDGRVVLALIEKWIKHSHTSLAVNAYEEGYWATAVRYRHNGDEEEAPRHYQANHPGSPGRAIVEACVSALREKSDG